MRCEGVKRCLICNIILCYQCLCGMMMVVVLFVNYFYF